ncbi:MAG: phosphoribosyltransferase family protein [Chloroflexi bacterium]|nr:phosphoribosyltransferase family protein [Chloroflexota bacterium]
MIRVSPDLLIELGCEAASSDKYGDALGFIGQINTPDAMSLKGEWSYQYGKQLVSSGKYGDAREFFAVAVQHHSRPPVRTLAQKRNELVNRILNGQTKPVVDMTDQFETVRIAQAMALPHETFAPLIEVTGCPAAYRSGYDPKRSDPLSMLIRTVKQESRDPVVTEERERAIGQVGDFLAAYAHASTPLLRDADLLVPVPSDLERLASRGYSIPLILAARVATRCAVPLYTNLIETTGPREDLRRLPSWARAGAVEDAYGGTGKATMLDGLSVIVVDDVLTTGATLREVASVLHDCGCRRVSALVLAHTEWGG